MNFCLYSILLTECFIRVDYGPHRRVSSFLEGVYSVTEEDMKKIYKFVGQ